MLAMSKQDFKAVSQISRITLVKSQPLLLAAVLLLVLTNPLYRIW